MFWLYKHGWGGSSMALNLNQLFKQNVAFDITRVWTWAHKQAKTWYTSLHTTPWMFWIVQSIIIICQIMETEWTHATQTSTQKNYHSTHSQAGIQPSPEAVSASLAVIITWRWDPPPLPHPSFLFPSVFRMFVPSPDFCRLCFNHLSLSLFLQCDTFRYD